MLWESSLPHEYVAPSGGSYPGTRSFRDRKQLRGARSTISRREKAGEGKFVDRFFWASDVSCEYEYLKPTILYSLISELGMLSSPAS